MKFSWKAIVLSPLAAPLVYTAALEIMAPGKNPLLSFLVLFGLSSLFSLGASILILLPSLFLASRLTPLTVRVTAVVGAMLGGVVYLPIVWQAYLASGDNSGPPTESFANYLRQHFFGT